MDTDHSALQVRPLILRPAAAAKVLGISRPHLYHLIRTGAFDVPRVSLGPKATGFRLSDLERWVASLPAAA